MIINKIVNFFFKISIIFLIQSIANLIESANSQNEFALTQIKFHDFNLTTKQAIAGVAEAAAAATAANTNNLNIKITNSQNQSVFESFNFERKDLFYSRLGKQMNLIISPILLLLGGFGNPLCILILTRKRQKSPTIIYICLLAVFDFLVLYTGLLRQYLKESIGVDFRNYSQFNCKFHTFLTYTFMQISSYILVAMTLNRFTIMFNRTLLCKVKKVNQNKTKLSIRSVFWITFFICSIISLMNLHFLIFYELTKDEDKQMRNQEDCTINKSKHSIYYYFRTEIFGQMHLYLFIVVPCAILFIMNILIIRKIMISSKSGLLNSRPSEQNKKREKKRTALSIMLVSVCLWFMILKTPASLYLTFPVKEMNQPHFPFTYSLFMLINYTNHAVNIILYIIISSSFRDEFKDFFVSIKRKLANFNTNKQRINKTRINNNNKSGLQQELQSRQNNNHEIKKLCQK